MISQSCEAEWGQDLKSSVHSLIDQTGTESPARARPSETGDGPGLRPGLTFKHVNTFFGTPSMKR